MNITDEIAPVGTLRPSLAEITRPRTPLTKVVRVLVLDDNEDEFAFVKVLLGKSLMCTYQFEWVPTEAAALASFHKSEVTSHAASNPDERTFSARGGLRDDVDDAVYGI